MVGLSTVARELVGSPLPRLSSPPRRPLNPDTSHGFALIDFAKRIGQPLLPWQEQAAIMGLELLEDGRYRYRNLLILVGRQSGKTHLMKVWALWRLCTDARVVIGVAQQLRVAQESWRGVVDYAEAQGMSSKVRRANGEQELELHGGARYLISAATRSAGRGFSADLLVMDELCEQHTEDAWAALSPTILARPHGQLVAISSGGSPESVVLNNLRAKALAGTDRVGLLEWSAPEGCELTDPDALAAACPGLGHTVNLDDLVAAVGSCSPSVARREYLCQAVSHLDTAIDPAGWQAGSDPSGSLGPLRGSLTAGIDVALDGNHVALVAAAALEDGRVRVEPVASWETTLEARREIASLIAQLAPQSVAWFPGGPANALAPILSTLPGQHPINGSDLAAACMGFADLARSGMVVHNANPLLDGQVARASKLQRGDGFVFTRKGQGNCNALYAAAGAVLCARTLKAPRGDRWVL